MVLAHSFDYARPRSVSDALRILSRFGSRAQVLAGGTDLIALIADGVARPEIVVDIKHARDLKGLVVNGRRLWIGALATFTDVLESKAVKDRFPVLWEMAHWVASNGIRNRATLIGNICSAVPCCDTGPILLLYDATVVARSARAKRSIPIEKWFVGPRKTTLRSSELAIGAEIEAPRKRHAACFVKLRRYRGEDLAQASVAVMALEGNEYRIAFGSVAPTPVRAHRLEKLLDGKPLSDDLIAEAIELLPHEIAPITDVRATREYRLHMCRVMLDRGLRVAVARLSGEGPAYGEEVI